MILIGIDCGLFENVAFEVLEQFRLLHVYYEVTQIDFLLYKV